MHIEPLQPHHWPVFLNLSRREGWRISRSEQRLYQHQAGQWPPQPFLCLSLDQQAIGFVSACCHQQSAWIGNLIIDHDHRGHGYGALLFDHVVNQLHQQGCPSLWLTASAAGQPLYERRGFTVTDQIERWVAPGLGRQASAPQHHRFLEQCDHRQHRQNRAPFLNRLRPDSRSIRCGSSIALLQPGDGLTQLGPWYDAAPQPQRCYHLLINARRACSRRHQLVMDLPASSGLQAVLNRAGFKRSGTTSLMTNTPCTAQRPTTQLALAGLGSFN